MSYSARSIVLLIALLAAMVAALTLGVNGWIVGLGGLTVLCSMFVEFANRQDGGRK